MKYLSAGLKIGVSIFLILLSGLAPIKALAGTWVSIGPDGGNVSQMVSSPNFANDNTMFAGTNGGGVFKSTDGGTSWTGVNTGLGNMVINVLVVSPGYSIDKTVLVGTEGGIFKTTDGANTWNAVNNGLLNLSIQAISLSPGFSSDNTLFTGTNGDGVFVSTNGGSGWTAINTSLGNFFVSSLAVSPQYGSDRTIYAGTLGGVYKTTNGGGSWSAINSGLAISSTTGINSVSLSPNYPTDKTVFAATDGGGVFKSANAGASWAAANTGLTNLSVTAVAPHPSYSSNQTLYLGSPDGHFLSTNGGSSWTQASSGMSASSVLSIGLSPNILIDQTLFAGTRGGAYKSSNGAGNWAASNTGIRNMTVKSISISPSYPADHTLFAVTVGAGIYKSTDGGVTWSVNNTSLPSQTVNSVSVSPNFPSDSTVFSSTSLASGTGGVFKSSDGGTTWAPASSGISNLNVNAVGVSPNFASDQTVFAGSQSGNGYTTGGLSKSTDGGNSWTTAGSGLADTNIQSTAVSPGYSTDQTVFVATPSGVSKSTDGGNSFSTNNTGLTTTAVNAITASPNFTVDNTVFAGTGTGGVFKSTDGGNSWSPASAGIVDTNITAVAASPDYANHPIVFAGTVSGGVYRSSDGGDHWTAANIGLGDADMLDVKIPEGYPCNGTVYGGTSGWSSAWEYDDDDAKKICPTNPPPPPSPVTITSITPASGNPGSQVTITGSGFGATQGTSTVTFNGIPAGIVSWSDTQIVATVPSVTTTGPIVVTVGGQSSNSNNIFTYYIGANAPDLSIWSLAGLASGTKIYISDTEKNSGVNAADTFKVAYFFSKNPSPNPATDSLIGTRTLLGLNGGGNNSANRAFKVPATTAVGNYYLCAITDFGNQVGEVNETNNTLCTATQYTIGPDLVIYSLSGSVYPGSAKFYVSSTDQNIGNQAGGTYTDSFYLSRNNTPNPATDALLGTKTYPSINGGYNTKSGSPQFTVPPTIPIGPYYLCQIEDSGNLVIETNEGNNTACTSGTFTIGPDVTFYSLSAQLSGVYLYVSDTQYNIGNQPAGSYTVTYYLSKSPSPNPATDAVLGSRTLSSLNPGSTNSSSPKFQVPASLPEGSYYVCGITDSGNAVAEINETNNTACTSGTFLIGPDLLPYGITGSLSGSTLSVSDTQQNIGSQAAGAFTVSYYLSTDKVYGAGDTYLGSRSLTGLNGGSATNSKSLSFTVPSGIHGAYYLIAVSDSGNAVTETNENNNNLSTTGTITFP